MQSQYQLYKEFSIEEFLLDETFLDWVKAPSEEKDNFWKQFLQQYPAKRSDLEAARRMVGQLQFQAHQPEAGSADRVWKNIQQAGNGEKGRVIPLFQKRWWAAAAVAVIILVAGSIWLLQGAELKTVQTAYGQVKNIELPDGSKIVLNANSKLTYNEEWNADRPREVWIDGVGYFEVVHKNKAGTPVQPAERFIVHMKKMNVEVLGTTFTVTTRRNLEQVVLQTGSVKVTKAGVATSLYLKPGEMAQYNEAEKTIAKATADTAAVAIWKSDRLQLNNTSLAEVVKLIEDTYGYKVVVTDTTLLERKLSGTLTSQNKEVLFKALETMLKVNISVADNIVTIRHK